MTYAITTTNWQIHRQSLRHIRAVVFIQEQQVPVADEWDDRDEAATHFLVVNSEGTPVGCARVLIEKELFHIGRVAVLAEYRKKGIGRRLMQFVVDWCMQQHPHFKIYLHAQTSRIGFYEYLGFTTQGDIFMDAGIEHIEMWHHHHGANYE